MTNDGGIEMNQVFCRTPFLKQLVGLAGLALSGFVLSHMLGNLYLFKSPEAYNLYGHKLMSLPGFIIIEWGLFAVFLLHIFLTIYLVIQNKKARPKGYAVSPKKKAKASLASKSMQYQGVLILFFLIWHLITLRYGSYNTVMIDGKEVRDLFGLILPIFKNPILMSFYVISILLLGTHLSHGFSSSFQSLGFYHEKYTPLIKKLGVVYAWVVTLGFLSQPLYIYFFYKA